MREVVCLDLPAGPDFVDRVRRAWDDGDAVFPLDPRLPAPARAAALAGARPTVLVDASGETRLDGEPCEDGDALLVATSGTTGRPRTAVLTLAALRSSAHAVADRLSIVDSDKWYACLPAAHVGGFSVIARSLLSGTDLVAVDRFDERACTEAARTGCTLVSLVPAALARIDASMFRAILLGGSAPPKERPANVIATYGMTETGGGVVYEGRPLDGVEVAADVDGQLLLRCPMLLRCYRDGSLPFIDGGWYPTGDLGSVSPDGSVTVIGRRGERIVTGGEKVWPADVENAIRSHPDVDDVCVAGVDDPEWGQAVHAWVVARDGATPTLGSVRAHVKESLPAYCAPKAVHLVPAIPRTALGKPRRFDLVASLRR